MQTIKKNVFINIHLTDDKEMKKLNKKYKNKNYPTDVLSFNIDEKMPDGKYYLGDVIVNIDQAKRQMKDFNNDDIRKEIAELAEHGILHLLGIHHEHDD